ncbi:MAG: YebC/PmpR family DNA-binding transcriptional regulator [Rhodobacteraceae bacterium]|nr:YebC/PmpR family DNA-binding transcriptional regulator [Paracoccaceae bacterium]
MAGHSKWAKVKHFKGAIDAKRSKMFAKLSKEITVATQIGRSGDPALNPRLRMVLLKSRVASMPKDNIERAIKRGLGDDGGLVYEDLTYEVFGPHGVAMLVELSTDNRNRTAAEIRSILTKNGGSIATAGAVSRLFQRKGQIVIARDAADEDTLMGLALEAGAEDFQADEHGYEILTDPVAFEGVHKAIEAKGITTGAAAVTHLPVLTVPVSGPAADEVQRLVGALDDHDDVKEVFANADLLAGGDGHA